MTKLIVDAIIQLYPRNNPKTAQNKPKLAVVINDEYKEVMNPAGNANIEAINVMGAIKSI